MQTEKLLLPRLLHFLSLFSLASVMVACGAGSGDGLDTNGQPINNGGSANDAYSKVQAVFDARCIVCHAGASAPQGLVLAKGSSYSQIVGVASAQQSDVLRIAPNAPEDSYLVRKIRGDSGITGAQMPRNGPPYLTQAQIQTIIDWVEAGAPAPQAGPSNGEFSAELSDFANYTNWKAVDYSIGDTNIALSGLHGSDDVVFSRRVFANEKALDINGEQFATGSILVKEVTTYKDGKKEFADIGGLLAMAKRGGGFNADNQGWEWFILKSDGSEILARGANVMDGGCYTCHKQADLEPGDRFGGTDYVFLHPSESVANSDFFSTYKTWPVIDTRNDDNPRLDGRAHGADGELRTRKVYKKQLYANPDTVAQGYPVGTAFVKEVIEADNVIAITAMVKRGADFNPDNGNWEWFLLDPATGDIKEDGDGNALRGADLNNNGCNGCHFAANTESGEGIDYVFKHADDPFNNSDEFIAELANFTDYKVWDLVDYSIGASNPVIGGGHQGMNDAFTRKVYANTEAVTLEGDTYKKGSIFVKEVTSWETGEEVFSPALGLVAMAKREGTFNQEHGGWEWFELDTELASIMGRGANYRNDGCNNCHISANSANSGTDYVFTHPTEFVAENVDFADYATWLKIDDRNDKNPLLGGRAHRVASDAATRRVYKKQPYAKALDNAPGYPVGTTIVKETSEADTVVEITAMVKRAETGEGGESGWEWFILDPVSGEIMKDENGELLRGPNLKGGGCVGCHVQANADADSGIDFVFPHKDDPVNIFTATKEPQ